MTFRLRIPVPASKKNRQQIWKNKRTGKRFITPSDEAKADEDLIHLLAKGRCRKILWPDEDVEVTILYHARKGECDVLVDWLAPKRKGYTGRKRDVPNIPEVILDALQGVVYSNDNQVARLTVVRVLPEE